jgi:hypothetical protein
MSLKTQDIRGIYDLLGLFFQQDLPVELEHCFPTISTLEKFLSIPLEHISQSLLIPHPLSSFFRTSP